MPAMAPAPRPPLLPSSGLCDGVGSGVLVGGGGVAVGVGVGVGERLEDLGDRELPRKKRASARNDHHADHDLADGVVEH